MYRYSSANNKTLIKSTSSCLMENSNVYSRETAFDPLNYEFDAETMIEPFTYFSNGPAESRRKFNDLSSPSITHFPLLSTHHGSTMSSPGESPQSYFSPIINEQFNGILQLKPQPTLTQQVQHPQQQSTYPKTICRHCKSHNMPECLYTSHTMYDETGAIFCPVLKKCHCATCMRVTNSNIIHDDDSDDDNTLRLTTNSNEFNHSHGNFPTRNSYRTMNNNNF